MANRPVPEVDVTAELVEALLADQCPDLVGLALRPLSRGWDNTNLLLGDELIVRIPHRAVAVELIRAEQRWLPRLAPQLDLTIPAPVHVGRPTDFFAWPWSITPFAPGIEAARAVLDDPAESARRLGDFYGQLHVPAPDDAPVNPFRGGPLTDRRTSFDTNLALLEPSVDRDAAQQVFDAACTTPQAVDTVWLHGDLHTRNMVVFDGALSSVIDWGDICAGDRATDLAGAFMLVPDHLEIVIERAGAPGDAWERARGWAVHFAVVYLAHGDDDPVMRDIGLRLLDTLR